MADPSNQTGARLLCAQLERLGVKAIFTVPGETFVSVLDGLFDMPSIRTVVCRHEGGAAMMAEAFAKMTGCPGVCLVTRAPGLANAMSGLNVARLDQSPLILFVGLSSTVLEDRGNLSSSEFQALFAALAKWSIIVRDAGRICEYVTRAFHIAATGQPGPVVVGLPEDILSGIAPEKPLSPRPLPVTAPAQDAVATLQAKLSAAENPLLIVGGPGWSAGVQESVERFAKSWDLPVAAAFRSQDYVDNRHPCYCGHAGIAMDSNLSAALSAADVLLVLGAHLGEVTTGNFELVKSPRPTQYLVHVYPSADAMSQACAADLPIVASSCDFAAQLAAIRPPRKPRWSAWRRDLRAAYEASLRPSPTPGNVRLEEVITALSKMLPEDAILCNGAGNYTQFIHRYFVYKGYRSCLAPASGSMGYGLPAAIAAKLADPDRTVVAMAGDGCLMMTVQELATAVQYGLPIIVIVANNGMLGTIRMHQETLYPGRVMATTLINPDFVQLAESFGAHAERVASGADFPAALERALQLDRPCLIELMLDPEAIAPGITLSGVRGHD